jgi:hypothetical protein
MHPSLYIHLKTRYEPNQSVKSIHSGMKQCIYTSKQSVRPCVQLGQIGIIKGEEVLWSFINRPLSVGEHWPIVMWRHWCGKSFHLYSILHDRILAFPTWLGYVSPMITLLLQHLQSGSHENFRALFDVPCIQDAPKKIWCDHCCKAEMDLYSHQAPECPHQACALAIWRRIKQPKAHTCSLYVWSRLCKPFTPKEMDRNGLFKLLVEITPAHCTVFLWYRIMCFKQGLVLPLWPKHGCTTTYVCHFWGVSSNQTLHIVAESCKMTCSARITTPSSSHKKLEAG